MFCEKYYLFVFQITKVKSSSKPAMGIPPSSAVQPPPGTTDVLDLSRARGAPSLFPPKSDEYKPLHIPTTMQVGLSFSSLRERKQLRAKFKFQL